LNQATRSSFILKAVIAFFCTLLFQSSGYASRSSTQITSSKTWQDTQAEYRQTLIERAQNSKRDFAKVSIMKSSSLELDSILLVTFSERLSLPDVQKYLLFTDGKLLELHRTVGDDHTSTGIDGLTANIEETGAKLRTDFLAYLDMRENELVTMLATLNEKHISAKQRIEFNLKSVGKARAATIKSGTIFDGVVIQIKNRNLAKAGSLPNGSGMMAIEFQENSRRSFALPHDVLKPDNN
jgi:hypothetical protein